jgi:hypothetical protein
MLDQKTSAAKLRQALASRYEDWRAEDPRAHTKSELARRCASMTGFNCTPQTVNGWFKTGRMDKLWIKPVEAILGASLGFDLLPSTAISYERDGKSNVLSAEDAAKQSAAYKEQPDVADCVRNIASLLIGLDGLKRKICAESIKHLAEHPDEADSVASSIKSLLTT